METAKPAAVRGVVAERVVDRIRGRVLGHDGAPVAFAAITVVRLDRPGMGDAIAVDDDGGFVVDAIDGIFELRVDATDHASLTMPIDGRDPEVELTIRLGTADAPKPPLKALITTAVIEDDPWSVHAGGVRVGKMVQGVDFVAGSDGVLTASVPAQPPGVLFTVMGAGGQAAMPASAGPFTPWAGFLLALAPSVDGRATLRVDLSRAPRPGVAAEVTVVGEATAALVRARLGSLAWGPADSDAPADAATCTRVAAAARGQDAAWWVYAAGFANGRKCAIAADDASAALSRIAADDLRWGLADGAFAATMTAVRARDAARADAYEQAFIAGQPNVQLVGDLLYARLEAGYRDKATARALVAQLRSPRFANTFAQLRSVWLDPDRIDVGMPTPAFSIAALDGGPPVTRESLLGTPHVLDFWGTWCSPCVESLPEIHAAYARLHGIRPPVDMAGWRGLTLGEARVKFVSISVHEPAEQVVAFRREQWPMPWIHAVAGNTSESLMDSFDIGGVPVALFVDANGVIVQREGDFAAGVNKLARLR